MIRPELELGLDDADVVNVRRRKNPPKGKVRTIKQSHLYCGAGGCSVGALLAYHEMRYAVELACVNHNRTAIDTHKLNHPGHIHLCTGVDRISPRALYRDEQMDALFASPSCTHFSSARGSSPVNPQERSSIQQVVRWIRKEKPIVAWIENVPELRSYGPVVQMRSLRGIPYFLFNKGTAKKTKWVKCFAPERVRPKGVHNRTWLARMKTLGYIPAYQPDPRYKGSYYRDILRRIRKEGYDVGDRIVNSADFGAATARKRLFICCVRRNSGMKIVWPEPSHVAPGAFNPLGKPTYVAARYSIDLGLRGESIFRRKVPLKPKTIKRIITGLFKYGIKPFLIPGKGTDTGRVASVDVPMHTITTTARGEALIHPSIEKLQVEDTSITLKPFLVPGYNERPGQTPRTHDIDKPAPVICATGHTHLTQPFLTKLRGTNNAADINNPAPTLTAGGTHLGVVHPFLYQTNHAEKGPTDAARRVRSVDDSFPVICGNRGEWALCESFLTQVSHGNAAHEQQPDNRRVKSLDEPIGALTRSNDWAVTKVQFILSQQSGGEPRLLSDPAPTIATGGAIHLIEAEIMKYALAPNTGYPKFEIDGEVYVFDAYHRMLDWPELARLQGFPDWYRFTGTKTEKIKQIGNAVVPLVARALTKAFWTQNPDVGVAPDWSGVRLAA